MFDAKGGLTAGRRRGYDVAMLTVPGKADAAERAAWRARGGLAGELADFLDDWDSPSPTMELRTSGSTGAPSVLRASKAAMRASAEASCQAFGLEEGDTALLCLPLRYIAGKMMVARALVKGLRLAVVDPSSTPFEAPELEGVRIDFAPLVPLQAVRTLARPGGAQKLGSVGALLLGGGFIDASLEEALQSLPCRAFASYGMTETLSHVALRRLNGPERSSLYTPLPGVSLALTEEGALCITAPALGIHGLVTHDLAEMEADGRFRVLGRSDAVINSGGVKIQAEELERALCAATGLELVAVPHPHPEYGSCVALLWEGSEEAWPRLRAACAALPRYHRPRLVRHVDALPRTSTGKIARAACREIGEASPLD